MESRTVIEMQEITKEFPGIIANDHISFDVREGEIHALLGENGAGKSTLMNVLSGLYRPDSGHIVMDGKPVNFASPKEAIKHGIGMIHQHFKLIPAFTVAENIILGDDRQPFFYNKEKAEAFILDCAKKYNMDIDPGKKVWTLSVGEQQTVEILKVLYRKARVLVLDEPTAVLTPLETVKLFSNLRSMTEQGCCVIIITHKLAEVCEIANRVTVLRRGKSVATIEGDDINYRRLSELMMMSESERDSIKEEKERVDVSESKENILEVEKLTVINDKKVSTLNHVSFSLRKGEILGIAGVSGNGQKELAEAIAGICKVKSGSIFLNGADITADGAARRYEGGIDFVPEDRLGMGLVGNMNIGENLILKSYKRRENKGAFIRYKKLTTKASEIVKKYDVAVANVKAPVRSMSGGNLQKVLLAREIEANPKVLIAAYPVRGLDVAASQAIFHMMLSLKQSGCGTILIAEDLDALFQYSDRIMVLYRGNVMGICDTKDITITDVGMMMMGTPLAEVQKYEVYGHF
ncbi:MAG: ABC transporter ATP-binding protein [Clostridiales bacterium]|nr:ABC transporter ATP-binding protein [Clostridiales bacterium]